MAKSSLKKVDVKKMTRLASAGVVTLSFAILISTAWFISRSLNQVAVAKNGTTTKPLKVEGVNTTLLEKNKKFLSDKAADDRRLGGAVGNPFMGGSEAPPAPPPSATAPAPTPAPATAPSPAPTPTPTPPPGT